MNSSVQNFLSMYHLSRSQNRLHSIVFSDRMITRWGNPYHLRISKDHLGTGYFFPLASSSWLWRISFISHVFSVIFSLPPSHDRSVYIYLFYGYLTLSSPSKNLLYNLYNQHYIKKWIRKTSLYFIKTCDIL